MAVTGIERIARRASSQPASAFTTLMHHYYSGEPASLLRGAGRKESARSRWSDESRVRSKPRGKPTGIAPETASDVVPPQSSTTSGDTPRGWHVPSPWDQLPGGQNHPGDDTSEIGSNLRASVYRNRLWIPPKAELSRCLETTEQRGDDQTRQLDCRHRSGTVLRHDATLGATGCEARAA